MIFGFTWAMIWATIIETAAVAAYFVGMGFCVAVGFHVAGKLLTPAQKQQAQLSDEQAFAQQMA